MRMLELTLAEPLECVGKKALVNPVHVVGVVGFEESGHTEVSFNGGNSTFRVQESYDEVKLALASI